MARLIGLRQKLPEGPIELDPLLEPWEPQPTETPRTYSYFNAFLMMGPDRRYEKLMRCDVVNPLTPHGRKGRDKPESNPSLDTILQWSRMYRWQERIMAWTAHQSRVNREQLLQRQKEMLEAHYHLVLDMQDILHDQVGKWVKKVREIDDKTMMSMEEVRKMAETVVKLGRLSLGMSDHITEEKSTDSTEQKIEALTREQRVKLLDDMMAGEGPVDEDVGMDMGMPQLSLSAGGNGTVRHDAGPGGLDFSGVGEMEGMD